MLTLELLKTHLHYNPETGVFTRLLNSGSRGKAGDIAGGFNSQGYIQINVAGTRYRGHLLAFLYMEGKFPDCPIDHINHIRHDNRWSNLRKTSKRGNETNASKRVDNTSGVTGVSWHKQTSKWRAYIHFKNKMISLGLYDSKEDAIKIREQALKALNYHPNHGK